MGVRIRRATLDECAVIAALEEKIFCQHGYSTRQIRYYHARERAFVLVAVDALGIAGYTVGAVNLTGRTPTLWIISLAVVPAQRRRGVGRRLVRAALAAGRRFGAEQAKLQVGTRNLAAQALYASIGFERRGRLVGYFGAGRDAILLRREV